MPDTRTLRAELPPDLDLDRLAWQHLRGGSRFDYPIDYAVAVLRAEPAAGRMDLLVKWAPHAYCHFHRHVCPTITLVIEGEQHVFETRPKETVHRVRQSGFSGPVTAGEEHMERAGPRGCLALFAMQSDDGRFFEILDAHGTVLAVPTLDDFVAGRLGRQPGA